VKHWLLRASLCASAIAGSVACDLEDEKSTSVEPREPSPNATIPPSPLVSGGSLVGKANKAAVGKLNTKKGPTDPAEPLVPLSVQQAPTRDEATQKLPTQVTLTGRLFWPAYPARATPNPKSGEPPPKGQREFVVNLRGHGRMQITFDGNVLPFESGSSIAARGENHGHFLVWPEAQTYRVLPVGSIRALFSEGRPDVTPIVHLEPEPRPGPDALGRPTQVWTFETNRGKLQLHQAQVEEAELGGPLLCRFLLEWLSVAPSSAACEPGLVPTRAELESGRGAKLVWETSDIESKADAQIAPLLIPALESQFQTAGLPDPGRVMAPAEMAALRKTGKTGTLTVHNPSPQLTWLLLDGAPVGRVLPNGTWTQPGLSQGSYQARLVDFFGVEVATQPGLVVGETATFGTPRAAARETEQ
jgi:hypothetical protein